MQITITDIYKRYGDVVALDGPSFEIPSGSTFGVLGTNGAGKSTLFGLLVGHDRPDGGTIDVGGLDVEEAGHRVRERVGFLPEHSGFPGSLTGREVLSTHARIRGLENRDERIEEVLELVGLTDAADRAVSGYSNGMGRRLGLAAALLPEPPVLVLDEPTAGLDPRGVTAFHDIVTRIGNETDTTVVLSSHVLSEVESLCDHVAILHDGRLHASGSVESLCATGDTVTVSVATTNPSARARLLEELQLRVEELEVVHRDGSSDRLEVRCDRSRAFDLVAHLESDLVEHFEVREPGLEAAFHRAVEGGSMADESAPDGHKLRGETAHAEGDAIPAEVGR
ncbi:ABC transporter ATP-binding protein [Halobacteria archaeon AArc-curdl1]|uniref:ABC transporter ATP-binding protein n=1 Tax=Natronosalvus hydrolyticus TaxID=2979988 RepID=A0AAP3E885_9EURY|nr:ABC transporter ATP-binding protein [Halobacteria archaeon AArc-curdl1]